MEKSELSVLIKHCFLMGKDTVQAKQWLDKYYSDSAPSTQMVEMWFADFKRGHTNTGDADRSGRPNSAVVPGNIKNDHKMVLADHKLKLREIADILKISEGSVFTILHKHMADVTTTPIATSDAVTPKKSSKKEKKSARPKTSHPTTDVMVNSAIQSLNESDESSLQAIKKYVTATYKVDAEKLAPFIKKYLKASVVAGSLVQTKGKGASISFKLAVQAEVEEGCRESCSKEASSSSEEGSFQKARQSKEGCSSRREEEACAQSCSEITSQSKENC